VESREDGNMEQSRYFEKFVKKYAPRIFKMIYNMINDYETTKDLTQDVFLKAWDNIDSFRGESSLYTWTYRIALNRVFEYRKNTARMKTIPIEEIEVVEIEEPEKILLMKKDAKLVKDSIKELPLKYQSTIILRYFEDKDYATIASILQIPIGTVRSRLHRGLSILMNILRGKL
jgi:RNA polymerase sigma-70 factor (ECF subfamily)